ncbi:MAG: helix-turn-helix domain-containing protein, partial [Desulfatitalea sp.]|nr:helix-turn-helix domain-containing protein [Desulfatitalea sp.]
ILKAHNRRPDTLDKPEYFWADGMKVGFDADLPISEKIDLGGRLKALRVKQGVSQKELAAMVGVTPSTISQIESNQIYPSLPALIKIAQVMTVDVAYFFHQNGSTRKPTVFSGEGKLAHFPQLPKGSLEGRQLLPMDLGAGVEPYLLEIAPGKRLSGHFFAHKGEEFGYLLEGELEVVIKETVHTVGPGDVVFLSRDIPSQWKNTQERPARLLWLKIL